MTADLSALIERLRAFDAEYPQERNISPDKVHESLSLREVRVLLDKIESQETAFNRGMAAREELCVEQQIKLHDQAATIERLQAVSFGIAKIREAVGVDPDDRAKRIVPVIWDNDVEAWRIRR